MHPSQRRHRLEEFERLCRQQGLPLTVQRRVILDALLNHADHPTADQIFREVKTRIPGVTRATVYRVLETLVRVGVARKVSHLGAAVRFDPNTDRHHHLVCRCCDKMVDLTLPALNTLSLPSGGQNGFLITDYVIHFEGLCAQCQQEGAGPQRAGRKKRRRRSPFSPPPSRWDS